MAQQFEPTLEASTRPQRMTADESRAVIDLWQQERIEQTGLTDKPAVPDVAEGLDITVEDVQRLLQDIRAKRLEEERILATEQELSKICLAEEERKLAEIQRQRAELQREQAEAARRRQAIYSQPSAYSRQARLEPISRHAKEEPNKSSYFFAALIACFALVVFLSNSGLRSNVDVLRSSEVDYPQHLSVTHASAIYDAQGEVEKVDMTCSDGAGNQVLCDNATITSETQYLQQSHDLQIQHYKKLADAQKAASKKVVVKKKHGK